MAAIFHTFSNFFLNENEWISIQISLKCVPEDPIENIPSDSGLAPSRQQAITWNNDN